MLVSPSSCYVVCSGGFMLPMGTPDTMYYFGETHEDTARARGAAEADAATARAAYPPLTFTVMSLDDFFSRYASDCRAEGERNASHGDS